MSARDPIGGFQWEHVYHTMHALDVSLMTVRTRHRFDLLAIRRERFFERRVDWTGSGIEKDPQILSGKDALGHSRHQLHGPVIRDGITRIMLIDLGRRLEPGDREVVEIEHTFIDVERTLKPFLGAFAREGTKTVTLSLILPDKFVGTVRSEKHPPDSKLPISQEFVQPEVCMLDGIPYRQYVLKEPDAQPGSNYRLSWNAKSNEQVAR